MKNPYVKLVKIFVVTAVAVGCGTALVALAQSSNDELYDEIVRLNQQIKFLSSERAGTEAQAPAGSVAGTATVSCTFSRNLYFGLSGEDVRCLQQYLNSADFSVAGSGPGSPGQETTYFGQLTRTTVARWQAAGGISPTAGYFGPISRVKYTQLIIVIVAPATQTTQTTQTTQPVTQTQTQQTTQTTQTTAPTQTTTQTTQTTTQTIQPSPPPYTPPTPPITIGTGSWPTYLHDNRRSAVGDGAGPGNANKLWEKTGEVLARDSQGRITRSRFFGNEGILAADEARVYVQKILWESGSRWEIVAALDARTGATLWEYQMPVNQDGFAAVRSRKTLRIRYAMLESGRLYLPAEGGYSAPGIGANGGFIALNAVNGQLVNTIDNEPVFLKYNTQLDANAVAVSNNTIYCLCGNAAGNYLVSLNTETDSLNWNVAVPSGDAGSVQHLALFGNRIYLNGHKEVAITGSGGEPDEESRSWFGSYDAVTGYLVWEKTYNESLGAGPLVIEGNFLYSIVEGSQLAKIDAATGSLNLINYGALVYREPRDFNSYLIYSAPDTAGAKLYRYHLGDVQPFIFVDKISGQIRLVINRNADEDEFAIASRDAFYDSRDLSSATVEQAEIFAVNPATGAKKWTLTVGGTDHLTAEALAGNTLFVATGEEGVSSAIIAIGQ